MDKLSTIILFAIFLSPGANGSKTQTLDLGMMSLVFCSLLLKLAPRIIFILEMSYH